jgi:glycosyltransferase involved in cell wall biosynthesis
VKRVLIFRGELLPLSETFIAGQAAALRRYEPWFAGLKRVSGGIALEPSRIALLSGGDRLGDKIKRRVYLRTGFAPAFLRRVQAIGPSLIHAHFALDAAAALPLQARLKVPLIVTLHGYDVTIRDASLRKSAAGRVLVSRRQDLGERASVFLCASKHIQCCAVDAGFPAQKLRVHRIGIDLDLYRPARDHTSEARPTVLFVGRMVEKKGCIHLIRAMARVQAILPEAQLVAIGSGPLLEGLRTERRMTLRHAVFPGACTPAEVQCWMRRAHVLALPSIVAENGDREGLPTVLCEAQAMGLPVVAFDGPGVREAVAAGETALLATSGSEEGLAAGILEVLRGPTLAARMGAAGRERAEALFNIRMQTAALEEVYNELLRDELRGSEVLGDGALGHRARLDENVVAELIRGATAAR